MMRLKRACLMGVLCLAVASCAAIDDMEAEYGVPQRAGIAQVTYVPLMSGEVSAPPTAFVNELGFDSDRSRGVAFWYDLPLAEHYDLRMMLDTGVWPLNWAGAGDAPEWSTTTIMFMLSAGCRFGRLGTHYRAGTGWQFNDLAWSGETIETLSMLALQMEFGVSVLVTQQIDIGLDIGWRSCRTVYRHSSGEHDQILDTVMAKLTAQYLF